ncbi:MAG: hypothetical protein K2N46_02875 [Lachnospiraceae bacterium]|nr:hypothetical protein [Lachnospiraceae bacterium]
MKKKILCLLAVVTVLNSSIFSVHAAGLQAYGGFYVKKTADCVTSGQTKETTQKATNWVEYVENNNKLSCWIQKSGSKISSSKSYTDSGYQYITYNDAASAKGSQVKLVVSTALTTLATTYTFGSWSPDYAQ